LFDSGILPRVVSGCPTVGRATPIGRALRGPVGHQSALPFLLKSDFARRVNLSQLILLFRNPNHRYIRNRPASPKGRFAIVTDARRDAVDADGASDEGA
jgi:hypothetical protein